MDVCTCTMTSVVSPGVHQHVYEQLLCKSITKALKFSQVVSILFALLGSACVKAARKMLMKLSLGLHRSEFTAGEIADEMEKERKYLQLTTADYLIKVNEVRTKKSVDLLQHLLEYYKAQYRYDLYKS